MGSPQAASTPMDPQPNATDELLAPRPLAWPAEPGAWPRPTSGRDDLVAVLQQRIPTASGGASPLRGGRRAALKRLAAIDPAAYGPSRNHLNGAITRLSADLRHGVLTLAEVRDAVAGAVLRPDGGGRQGGETLMRQLGWRDHWQRLWRQLGDRIWDDLEPMKTGHPPHAYGDQLPEDVREARTGLACIDAFSEELQQSGWLHNHSRLWLASYLVHGRKVRWQAGARWFLTHLLDGDAASNALSWQWVASSFSHKPYLFNRANLVFHGAGHHCEGCPAAAHCPLDGSDEDLKRRWLNLESSGAAPSTTKGHLAAVDAVVSDPPPPSAPSPEQQPLQRPIVWVHDGALSSCNPALVAWPEAPAIFVFDQPEADLDPLAPPLSLKRLLFQYECLLELPVTIQDGDGAEAVLTFAQRCGADGIVTTGTVDPRLLRMQERLRAVLPLQVLEPEPFVRLSPEREQHQPPRFSGQWRQTVEEVWRQARPSPSAPPPPA